MPVLLVIMMSNATIGNTYTIVAADDGVPDSYSHNIICRYYVITSGMCPLHYRMMYDYGY